MPLPYIVLPLAEIFDGKQPALAQRVRERLNSFECHKSPHLQEFARSKVHKFEQHGHSRTYVFIVGDGNDDIDIPAFFTIGVTVLDLREASRTQKSRLCGDISMDVTGAYSIAELARSDRYSSKQVPGRVILDEANNIIRGARNFVAGRFIVVDAQPVVFDRLYEPAGYRMVGTATAPRGMSKSEFVTACCKISDWPAL